MSVMETEGEIRLRGKRRPRPCSASYIAVRAALYQLTRLSDFRAEKIGGGFYADVFKVTHKSTGEVMVLKMNKNRKFSRQMLSEIQLMNRLSHPNILKFKGSCVHEGQLHALTEYINGGSLEDLLHDRSIDLSWSARVKIALDIAQGMAYLHSRGVFHRDLSSRNCLIQILPDGTMKTLVADFGLAAKIKQSRRRSHTEVVGSPYWMAPECLNGKEYCEQADVFSYGIVLAETMTRLPADPDFMPRTKIYGMDFKALHKMCPDCPQALWELMVRCCQIDPDERPIFDEAVQILQALMREEGEGEAEREEDSNLRASFSEPLLGLHDSDDNMSFTSGQSSTHLPPINSSDSLDSCSANSPSTSAMGYHLELEHKTVVSPEPEENDCVFEDADSSQTTAKECDDNSTVPPTPLADGKMSFSSFESDDDGPNKGDSGIDPGELFVGPVVNYSEGVGRYHEELSTCSESDKTPSKEELEQEERMGAKDEAENRSGDVTPSCTSPTHTATNLLDSFRSLQLQAETNTGVDRTHPAISVTTTPSMFSSPSNDSVPPTTPFDRNCSPQAPSSASEVSLYIPNPSTPWAPPPSPIRSNSYRLSSSLPSSPTQQRRPFRFSMEVQEALFPPFDLSMFTSPSISGIKSINLRSTPKSSAKFKSRSLKHSCGHTIPLPTFPEDSETENGLYNAATSWRTDSSLCMNLDREKFSVMSQSIGSLRRTRSSSNPATLPVQPSHYSLTLARYSPGNSHMNSNSPPFFKYYTIKPCQNCRLSTSAPNLTAHFSANIL